MSDSVLFIGLGKAGTELVTRALVENDGLPENKRAKVEVLALDLIDESKPGRRDARLKPGDVQRLGLRRLVQASIHPGPGRNIPPELEGVPETDACCFEYFGRHSIDHFRAMGRWSFHLEAEELTRQLRWRMAERDDLHAVVVAPLDEGFATGFLPYLLQLLSRLHFQKISCYLLVTSSRSSSCESRDARVYSTLRELEFLSDHPDSFFPSGGEANTANQFLQNIGFIEADASDPIYPSLALFPHWLRMEQLEWKSPDRIGCDASNTRIWSTARALTFETRRPPNGLSDLHKAAAFLLKEQLLSLARIENPVDGQSITLSPKMGEFDQRTRDRIKQMTTQIMTDLKETAQRWLPESKIASAMTRAERSQAFKRCTALGDWLFGPESEKTSNQAASSFIHNLDRLRGNLVLDLGNDWEELRQEFGCRAWVPEVRTQLAYLSTAKAAAVSPLSRAASEWARQWTEGRNIEGRLGLGARVRRALVETLMDVLDSDRSKLAELRNDRVVLEEFRRRLSSAFTGLGLQARGEILQESLSDLEERAQEAESEMRQALEEVPAHMPNSIDRKLVQILEARVKTHLNENRNSSLVLGATQEMPAAFAYMVKEIWNGAIAELDVLNMWTDVETYRRLLVSPPGPETLPPPEERAVTTLESLFMRLRSQLFWYNAAYGPSARCVILLPKRSQWPIGAEVPTRQQDLKRRLNELSQTHLHCQPCIIETSSSKLQICHSKEGHAISDLSFLERLHDAYGRQPDPACLHVDRRLLDLPEFKQIYVSRRVSKVACGNPECQGDITDHPRNQAFCLHCGESIRSRCGNQDCTEDALHRRPEARARVCPICGGLNQSAWWACYRHGKGETVISAEKKTCPACINAYHDGLKQPEPSEPFDLEWISRNPRSRYRHECFSCRLRANRDREWKIFEFDGDLAQYCYGGVPPESMQAFQRIARRHGLLNDHKCPLCEAILIPTV